MLSKIQEEIVNTTDSKVVVIAAAASGKTAVITERVKHLLAQGERGDRIVVITFTNAAADEMRKRIGSNEPFIGTIHSYANRLLIDKGFNTSDCIESEDFDKMFKIIKRNPEVIIPVDHLLLDEAQDSSDIQYEFLLDMIKPKNYFIVGDYRQSIYEWNGARPDILEDLKDKVGVKTYNLNENYRNGYKILNFAREIIGKLGFDFEDNSKSMTGDLGKVLKAEYKPSIILSYIQGADKPKDWFVLTRTNAQLDDIYRFLVKNGIPCDTFKRSGISAEEFKKKMNENTVKVLTVHAAKGLEAKNVIVIGTNNWKPEEVRIQYVAATRAKELLIWMKEPPKRRKTYTNWE